MEPVIYVVPISISILPRACPVVRHKLRRGANPETNGRGQVTDYTFDSAGRLSYVSYSDGTPSVTLDYDRAGRLRSVTDAAGARSLSWTDRDQMGDESYTNGLPSGVTVTRGYDAQFRLSTLGLSLGGTPTTRRDLPMTTFPGWMALPRFGGQGVYA